jgi:hypothetical protein
MSDERRSPPPDWRHGGPLPEEAPHRRARKLRDDPEVKELLAELSQGLKPGEDPLFYELPQEPDDPEACAPNEARVYVGPTAPPKAHHETLELARVKVAPSVDPRRAPTQRIQVKRAVDPREDAPPMSGPASPGPQSAAGKKKPALVLALGAVAVAVVVVAALQAPGTPERPATSATAGTVSSAAPSVTAAPTPTEIPATTATPAATATPAPTVSVVPSSMRPGAPPGRRQKEEDPYDAAAVPIPTVTSAPSAAPTVTPAVAPAPVAPKAPATSATARPTPPPSSGPILGEKE